LHDPENSALGRVCVVSDRHLTGASRVDGRSLKLELLSATRLPSSNRLLRRNTMARVVGPVALERVLVGVGGLDGGTLSVGNIPLLGLNHDQVGGDEGKESRSGDDGGESELHFV
jgi:hypothetical protein